MSFTICCMVIISVRKSMTLLRIPRFIFTLFQPGVGQGTFSKQYYESQVYSSKNVTIVCLWFRLFNKIAGPKLRAGVS